MSMLFQHLRLAADEFELVIFVDCINDDRSVFLSEREDAAVLRRSCKCSMSLSVVWVISRFGVEAKRYF
jgi:hypothetical protein